MSHYAGALAWAEAQVAAARDDPAERLALLARTYRGPTGRAPRHLPFRRAALSFMRWQTDRGVLGRLLGDPRLGMAGAFLSLGRVLPERYPLAHDVQRYIAAEHRLGRMLDYAVIVPRLQSLYEWSAEELGESRLLEFVRDGNPI